MAQLVAVVALGIAVVVFSVSVAFVVIASAAFLVVVSGLRALSREVAFLLAVVAFVLGLSSF